MQQRSEHVDLRSLDRFMQDVRLRLIDNPDLVLRFFGSYLVIYIAGLVDLHRLQEEVIGPLRIEPDDHSVHAANLRDTAKMDEVVQALLTGNVVIGREGDERVLLAHLTSIPERSVEEPQTEAVIRGPREGFTERLETNMALIRYRLPSERLRVKQWFIGRLTRTEVRLLYLDGITEPGLVEEISRRIAAIDQDVALDSNYIEEMIRDHRYNLLPTVQSTERPDVVAGALSEGRIGILVDNSPQALIMPFQFWSGFQASEDYYSSYLFATFVRTVRAIFIFIALLLPSFYVAITTFHQDMLPTSLLFSVAASREATPFPALVEALMMEFTFEALREAGLRLPPPVGEAVSIVGALVIGQAAVEAGIVSAPMVIVVSLTGIASFTIPRYNVGFALRILRFPLILLAGTLGLFGIMFGIIALAINLTGVYSAGVP
ncbi:spore germination protein [Brevibacillus humidisoli]|uniref:spore germination protein n=1 Tax=Brevibacillus humidisoli TaxID=2895522 RepID=UPI001E29E725|nr:spore germination protein [Brevibacillus humidisoli]UFJ39142.1 spore germination protein [Brevibacillus humidisoli]